jgi:molybdopterin biosynthesis enzyme
VPAAGLLDPDVGAIYTKMASTMPSLANITWDRLVREGAVTYPTDAPDKPGNEIIFGAGYPTKSGRGKPRLRRFSKKGAGLLTSLTETDGLAELPETLTQLEPGMTVDLIPYRELL